MILYLRDSVLLDDAMERKWMTSRATLLWIAILLRLSGNVSFPVMGINDTPVVEKGSVAFLSTLLRGHKHTHATTDTFKHVTTDTFKHALTNTCAHKHMCPQTSTQTHTHTNTHTHTHTHTYTHIHTHTHTHTLTLTHTQVIDKI